MKYYTETEIQYIKDNYRHIDTDILAQNLGRSVSSIRTKAYELGLKKIPKKHKNYKRTAKSRIWTDEQIKYLRQNYLTKSYLDLSNVIKKSAKAIAAKARSIDLIKNKSWTTTEINFLKNNYPQKSVQELSKIINHSYSSIMTQISTLGLKRVIRQPWTVSEILLLHKLYVEYTLEDLSIILKRSAKSVVSKACHLGIYNYAASSLELKFADLLKSESVDFKEQCRCGKYIIDFVIKKYAIETHGSYWHCDPRIYINGPITTVQNYNIRNDLNKKKYLEKRGYKVLIVWEKDLYENFEQVKNNIVPLLRDQ